MLNLILFGPPGSGKGTQAEKLVDYYGLTHISTGDLFRYEMKNDTPLGLKAKEYINQGKLVPDEVTFGMLKNKVEATKDAKGFIFDGFPRTIPQAEALDAYLASMNAPINVLTALHVDDEEVVKRIIKRGETSGRADDQDPVIAQKRIDVYKAETTPVYDFYAAQNKSVTVNGMGSIDEVFTLLTNAIGGKAEN